MYNTVKIWSGIQKVLLSTYNQLGSIAIVALTPPLPPPPIAQHSPQLKREDGASSTSLQLRSGAVLEQEPAKVETTASCTHLINSTFGKKRNKLPAPLDTRMREERGA